jgi:hypothetical protein
MTDLTKLLLTKDEVIQGCGAGRGHDCCRYLVAGGDGFECARVSPGLKKTLDDRGNTMTAQRSPTADYPQCQLAK